jgi:monofunctional biosynthetic peptidoglycan transglycosylase
MTALTQQGSSEEGGLSLRRSLARVLWGIAIVLLIVLLVQYLLVPLYRFVDPVSTPMLARWLAGRKVVHTYVPIGAMAPSLPLAVLAAEDDRFCSHHGVDLRAIDVAVKKAHDFSDARGSSTITQQTAKNLFLWEGRSVVRKALELPLALWIDLVLPKRRIMEIYLNIAEWGPNGEFGAEAGARAAFDKGAAALDVPEAATLAAILPNPLKRNARPPGPGVRRLSGIYQGRARAAVLLAGCLQLKGTSARPDDPL